MKIKNIFLTLLIAFMSMSMSAQKSKTVTTTFWVAGICGMCEEAIEKAMDVKGVIAADYELTTNNLTVIYKPAKVSEDQLHKLLNEVGYDTEKSTCTESQYNLVHDCCRYRELEKH